jgi:hypothetical protein
LLCAGAGPRLRRFGGGATVAARSRRAILTWVRSTGDVVGPWGPRASEEKIEATFGSGRAAEEEGWARVERVWRRSRTV